MKNGRALPVRIAGGGIGGLAAAHALARKGFAFARSAPVSSSDPTSFASSNRSDLRRRYSPIPGDRRPAQAMRCALSGVAITRIPLGANFAARFGQPYAVTHRADIHCVVLAACQGSKLLSLETQRRAESFADHGES